MHVATAPVGSLVRRWRQHRRRSQLDVSLAAELSTRHLSYIETGRSHPSRSMLERLCDELDVPLRDRNDILLAAGYAPAYPERPFDDLGAARSAVEAVLQGMDPNPAMAVNVHWELLAANVAAAHFLADIAPELARPPINVLRATLHPKGLAPRIRNFGQWRGQLLRRVRRQWERTASPRLPELLAELESYPVPDGCDLVIGPADQELIMPMRLATEAGDLDLLYTLTVFGAPRDVTVDEIALETFFPADERTAGILARSRRS